MRRAPSATAAFAAVLLALAHAQTPPGTAADARLGPPRAVANGVTLYHLDDPQLLSPPGPVSIWILRVDPATADVRAALATDEIVGTETVGDLASRHRAAAAVNAGFF